MDSPDEDQEERDIVARDLTPGEGGVLLHLESAEYFSVNQLGMFIWDALEPSERLPSSSTPARRRSRIRPGRSTTTSWRSSTRARDRGIVVRRAVAARRRGQAGNLLRLRHPLAARLPLPARRDGQASRDRARRPGDRGAGDEPLLEWLPAPTCPSTGAYTGSRRGICCGSRVSAGSASTRPARGSRYRPRADRVRREERIWGLPAILCLLGRGDLPLHAAAVEIDGKAVVLGAPERSARRPSPPRFARDGFRLLSEDLTCVRAATSRLVVPGRRCCDCDTTSPSISTSRTRPARPDADDRVHLAFSPTGAVTASRCRSRRSSCSARAETRSSSRRPSHGGGPRPLVAELQRADGRRSRAVLRRDHRARHVRAGLEPPPPADVRALRPTVERIVETVPRRPPCGSARGRRRGSRSASGARTRG